MKNFFKFIGFVIAIIALIALIDISAYMFSMPDTFMAIIGVILFATVIFIIVWFINYLIKNLKK